MGLIKMHGHLLCRFLSVLLHEDLEIEKEEECDIWLEKQVLNGMGIGYGEGKGLDITRQDF